MYFQKASKIIIAYLSLTFIFMKGASANYMVYPMSASVKAGENATLKIYSKSPENQYIKISVKKVFKAGTKNEYEEPVKNWDPKNLIISPSKIILSGGGSNVIRLTQVENLNKETLYRVYFESVSSNMELKKTDEIKKQTNASLSVNVILAALVRVLPKEEITKINVIQENKNIIIENLGNIRVGIKSLKLCPSVNLKKDCESIAINRYIYPEQKHIIKDRTFDSYQSLYAIYKNADGGEVVEKIK